MRAVPAGEFTAKVGQYLCEKVSGVKLDPGMFSAFAFLADDGEFVGGCTISSYTDTDCQISCAVERNVVFRPHIMRAVFQYIFVQLNCVRCTSLTTVRNERARRFLDGLGFVLEGKLRRGYDGERDALIYGLLKSDCRYLGGEGDHGKIDAASADAA